MTPRLGPPGQGVNPQESPGQKSLVRAGRRWHDPNEVLPGCRTGPLSGAVLLDTAQVHDRPGLAARYSPTRHCASVPVAKPPAFKRESRTLDSPDRRQPHGTGKAPGMHPNSSFRKSFFRFPSLAFRAPYRNQITTNRSSFLHVDVSCTRLKYQ